MSQPSNSTHPTTISEAADANIRQAADRIAVELAHYALAARRAGVSLITVDATSLSLLLAAYRTATNQPDIEE